MYKKCKEILNQMQNEGNIKKASFEFPQKQELKLKLADILESNVDEKYYLDDKQVARIFTTSYVTGQRRIQEKDYCDTLCARDWKDPKCIQVGELDIKGHDCIKRVYSPQGCSPTITTCGGGNREPKIIDDTYGFDGKPRIYEDCPTIRASRQGLKVLKGGKQLNETIEKNIDKFEKGKVLNMDLYNRTVNENLSQTLCDPTHNSQRLFDGYRIRKLTPRECWRLMGFDDSDFEKAAKVNSNTQLYKQAGNSIVVNVLEAIFKNLLLGNKNN